jgi:hypothetical protein
MWRVFRLLHLVCLGSEWNEAMDGDEQTDSNFCTVAELIRPGILWRLESGG